MSRTSRERLVFPTVIISVVLAIFMAGMHAGRFNMARAAEASKTDVSAEGHESPEGELQQLLLERKRLLNRIVEYRDANIALLRAEMDLCKTRDARLKILEKIVQFHTEYEAWVERKAANGRTTRIDVEKAKIARLEAQIELARENMKGQSPEQ